MSNTRSMQDEIVGIEGDHHPLLRRSEVQLVRVRKAAATCLLGRQDINTMLSQSDSHGPLYMLVEIEPNGSAILFLA